MIQEISSAMGINSPSQKKRNKKKTKYKRIIGESLEKTLQLLARK